MELQPPVKKQRGPYRQYHIDQALPIPKTTRWRMKKEAETENSTPDTHSESSENSDDDVPVVQNTEQNPDNSLAQDGFSSEQDEEESEDIFDSDCDSPSELIDDECLTDDTTTEMFTTPIYAGAKISIAAACIIIMEFKRTCRLPFTAIVVLLQLLQLFCPVGNKLPTTKHQLLKFFRISQMPHERSDYCRTCSADLNGEKNCSNNTCIKAEPNSLIQIPPDKMIQKIVSDNWTHMKDHKLTKKNTVGLIFNTDGVSPFKSSLITIWPIYIVLANLSPNIMMLKRNIVTCAVWIGNCKPPMKIFLTGFKALCNRIGSLGLRVTTSEGVKTFFFQPLFGVFDLMAKAPLLNMNQFNGEYGCPTCLHPGSWLDTRIYLPEQKYPLRTHSAMTKAANTPGICLGIKGPSILSEIVSWEYGAPIDYMHCVLEGVTKRVLNKWCDSKSNGNPFYIGRKIPKIDDDLIIQKPPHDFTRAPRSIKKHRKHWKASEFRSWLLFYSLPLLVGYLPPLYLHHFALLVCSIHILLQPELTDKQIEAAQLMLEDYVTLVPELYGERECTINNHLLLHLCHYAKKWGPLWAYSAFGFESMNGHLTGHIHSPYRLTDQLLFSIKITNSLNSKQEQLLKFESEEVLGHLSLNSNTPKGIDIAPKSYAVGPMVKRSLLSHERNAIKSLTGTDCSEIICFHQVYHQGTLLQSASLNKLDQKRNSTVCSFLAGGTESYGVIECFCMCNSIPIALIRPYKLCSSYLKLIGNSGRPVLNKYADCDLLSSFLVCVKNPPSQIVATFLSEINRKCIYVKQISSSYGFVVKLPNYYEYH